MSNQNQRSNSELHERAERLIAQERIEGLSAGDLEWLHTHLAECSECAARATAMERAIRSLRGISVELPKTLASRTQFRVRMRAQQLRGEPRWRLVWGACGVSWAFGAATAPYVWRGLEWVGHRMGLPNFVWELGFGLWWALPAAVVGLILMFENAARRDWSSQETLSE